MKTVLVTGGAGFIGSHLVEKCLSLGHRVVCIDNFAVGRMENLETSFKNKNFSLVKADVAEAEIIQDHFRDVDWVFHLAALADIVPSIQNPMGYHRANVEGTVSVLEAAKKYNIKRFVYAASSSCYGIPDQYPTPETAEIQTKYPYALTKFLGERYVLHWAEVYKLPALSLRFFNVFGPRARTSGTYGAVFGVFLAQKFAGKPLTVVGDGTQSRDFTYVSDVVDALYAAAGSGISGQVYNVGSGNTYTVNELVKLLDSPVTYIPKRPGEPDCTFADITKIRRELGWEPKVKFQDGVKQLLLQLEKWKNAPVWTPETIETATKEWFQFVA